MATNSLDVYNLIQPDILASAITDKYEEWKSARSGWESSVKEVRDYLYATDTSTTGNSNLPFSNRTTIPKLMQIAQNLHANYFEHLFSNPDFISWEASDWSGATYNKKKAITSYIRTKSRQLNMPDTFSKLLWDWIIYGNCFAQLIYVNEFKEDPITKERIQGYVGPKLMRISPFDIVFNPAAVDFRHSPKIVRKVYAVGDLIRMSEEQAESGWTKELVDKIQSNRMNLRNNSKQVSNAEMDKGRAFTADGFSDLVNYYNSDLVEVLEFFGDFYDGEKQKFYKDHHFVIVDRAYVVDSKPSSSWTGSSYFYHDGWAKRPDNLYGMGPLEALVGMQYKLDKLENLRGDIFDHIAHPVTVETGTVEFFGVRGAPGGRYVVDEGGAVDYLHPDTTALQADFQIQQIMTDMELLAGSPREAMGFRTPGEKTATEMQILDNSSNRIFRNKTNQYEVNVVEKAYNDFLEMARRNLDGYDVVRNMDNAYGIEEFIRVTREDITASGKLYATGSKHFISNSNMVQNLQAIFNTPVAEFIAPHISKFRLAKAVEDLLGVEKFGLVQENIGVLEDVETQRVAQTGQQMLDEEAITDPREMADAEIGESEAAGPAEGQEFGPV